MIEIMMIFEEKGGNEEHVFDESAFQLEFPFEDGKILEYSTDYSSR